MEAVLSSTSVRGRQIAVATVCEMRRWRSTGPARRRASDCST